MAKVRQAYTSVYAKRSGEYSGGVRQKLAGYETAYRRRQTETEDTLRRAYGAYIRKRRADAQTARAAGESGGILRERGLRQTAALESGVRTAGDAVRDAYETLRRKTDETVLAEEARLARADEAARKAAEREKAAALKKAEAEKKAAQKQAAKRSSAGSRKTASGKKSTAKKTGSKKKTSSKKKTEETASRKKKSSSLIPDGPIIAGRIALYDPRRADKHRRTGLQ